MSLWSSLYAGVSGLETNSIDLSIIGDNIANGNTIGFKGSRAAFEEALAQSMIGGSQRGLGARVQAIQRLVTQGALSNTGLATDLAISGPGMFVVRGNHNGADGTFFTRAGQFTLDRDGFLVSLEGLKVQGYPADQAGNVGGALSDLEVGSATSPPRATTTVGLDANLQADAVVPAAFDPLNAAATSNFSTSITVYDSLGQPHALDVYFRKTAAGSWEWHALTDGGGLTGGTAGTPTEVASGTLTFDTQGALTAQTQTSSFNPAGAQNPQALSFDFGTPSGAGGTGLDGITQFAGASATTFESQDGFAAGTLARLSIDAQGLVTGAFTNGQTRVLGQVALADFQAPDQLERVGGNLYAERPASGSPTIGAAASGGRGAIVAGALEQSNVDLATEFVRMIAAQRGFQANSKTITTADQLLAELIQLKR